MKRVLHIARREWTEQTRQPVMLGVIAALFLIVGGLVLSILAMLDAAAADEDARAALGNLTGLEPALALSSMTESALAMYNFLIFTQFLGIAAVLAGHSVLHDRQTGTLTFLLLAPVRRVELLLGKVLGAIGPSFVMYLVVSGGACLLATTFPITAPYAVRLPPSPAFMVAFLLGGPLWAVFIGTICTIVSSLSHDVRTAQQGVWFVVFFATMISGFLLSYQLPQGVIPQLMTAALGGVGAAGALAVGAMVISRDLSR